MKRARLRCVGAKFRAVQHWSQQCTELSTSPVEAGLHSGDGQAERAGGLDRRAPFEISEAQYRPVQWCELGERIVDPSAEFRPGHAILETSRRRGGDHDEVVQPLHARALAGGGTERAGAVGPCDGVGPSRERGLPAERGECPEQGDIGLLQYVVEICARSAQPRTHSDDARAVARQETIAGHAVARYGGGGELQVGCSLHSGPLTKQPACQSGLLHGFVAASRDAAEARVPHRRRSFRNRGAWVGPGGSDGCWPTLECDRMLVRVSLGIRSRTLRQNILGSLSAHDTLLIGSGGLEDLLEHLDSRSTDIVVIELAETELGVTEWISRLQAHRDRPELVVLGGEPGGAAPDAMANGASAVLDVTLEPEAMAATLASLVARRREARLAQSVVAERVPRREPPRLVSASAAMGAVLDTAQRVATSQSPVLVLGETGVGKERIAEVLHRASHRSEGPFVPVNCAAIPEELFEAELFGHEEGAFTGARRARRGLFELAHEGTLFLDEVGEVPLRMQSKLLRALQEQSVRPLGGGATVDVDVRIVSATNRDLSEEIAAGRFRRDLYYRLGVIELRVPPLRDRPDDIVALSAGLLEHYCRRLGRGPLSMSERVRSAMLAYPWPGNVRELGNTLERAALLVERDVLELSDLPASIVAHGALAAPPISAATEPVGDADPVVALPPQWSSQTWRVVREGLLSAGERAYLAAVLKATGGRVGEAAKRSGMSSRALFEKMRRHGLRKEDYRDPA